MELKKQRCTKCNRTQHVEEFRTVKDRLQKVCNTCFSEYRKTYYQKNKIKWVEYHQAVGKARYEERKPDQTLIYGIYSKVYEKIVYVGKTDTNLEDRIGTHRCNAITRGSKSPLSSHIRTHGWPDLQFRVLDENPNLIACEAFYAIQHDTYENGFNVNKCSGHSEELESFMEALEVA